MWARQRVIVACGGGRWNEGTRRLYLPDVRIHVALNVACAVVAPCLPCAPTSACVAHADNTRAERDGAGRSNNNKLPPSLACSRASCRCDGASNSSCRHARRHASAARRGAGARAVRSPSRVRRRRGAAPPALLRRRCATRRCARVREAVFWARRPARALTRAVCAATAVTVSAPLAHVPRSSPLLRGRCHAARALATDAAAVAPEEAPTANELGACAHASPSPPWHGTAPVTRV